MDISRVKAEQGKRDTARSSYVSDDRWRLAKSRSRDQIDQLFEQNRDAIIALLYEVGLLMNDPDFASGNAAIRSGQLATVQSRAGFLTNTPTPG